MSYAGRVEGPQEHPNVTAHAIWERGEVEEGFVEADYVFEHTFRTQHQHQAYMERGLHPSKSDIIALSKQIFAEGS